MFFLRFALLFASLTSILASTARTQIVEVSSASGTLAFRDQTSGSGGVGARATTRIHEGDTVQFVWQVSNYHTIDPYDTTPHNSGTVSVSSSSITLDSARRSTYQCRLHPQQMIGEIFVYEIANHFVVTAPTTTAAGSPFSVTVKAVGPNGTVDELYRGTIQFSSSDSDSCIRLPGNYTFVAADNGTHTFNGVVLKALNPASVIAVRETAGLSSGQTSVSVTSVPDAAVSSFIVTHRTKNVHAAGVTGGKFDFVVRTGGCCGDSQLRECSMSIDKQNDRTRGQIDNYTVNVSSCSIMRSQVTPDRLFIRARSDDAWLPETMKVDMNVAGGSAPITLVDLPQWPSTKWFSTDVIDADRLSIPPSNVKPEWNLSGP